MVYRKTSKSAFKKMVDIYYYTPSGKKVRSKRELLEYCKYVVVELLQNIIAFSCHGGKRWNVCSKWLSFLYTHTHTHTHIYIYIYKVGQN